MKKQVYNPFLPLGECVPDGEPHVFGDRVYIFGSHDKEGGETFCMLDYVTYSAPVNDLTDWRYEGVIYRAEQDPQYGAEVPVVRRAGGTGGDTEGEVIKYLHMYAPDVVQGNDGKFYLYYGMSGKYGIGGYIGPLSVAVSDSPAGPYEFLGFVRNEDGTPFMRYVLFDPAVINDNGTIRLYYGTQYCFEELDDFTPDSDYVRIEAEMFGRTPEEILSYPDSIMGPVTVELKDDMLTVAGEARHVIPYRVKGTAFDGHGFFEGSSIRKVGDKYYFVYSSQRNHELCYAISDYPDRDFVFGGTIVSNGDVGFNGRSDKDRLNMTGTTHGSIEYINGQWYVFYHRLTHQTDYSRQACAEKITILPDGSIPQVEITSCGLNNGPLVAEGAYPAGICCNLTNGSMPHGSNSSFKEHFPHVNHRPVRPVNSKENNGTTVVENARDEVYLSGGYKKDGMERYVAQIGDGTLIGYKFFDFKGVKKIGLTAALSEAGEGEFLVRLAPEGEPVGRIKISSTGEPVGTITVSSSGEKECWDKYECDVDIPDGVHPLYFTWKGNVEAELLEFEIIK